MYLSWFWTCFVFSLVDARPLYLEIRHIVPETGEIITTNIEFNGNLIKNAEIFQPYDDNINLINSREINPADMGYYYDCAMPVRPPIETSYHVRQEQSSSNSLFGGTLASVNGVFLNIMSIGFDVFNTLWPY